jgi:hypothetical protein
MNKQSLNIGIITFILGVLASGFLIYIMLAFQIHLDGVFRDHRIEELWEYAIVFGFLLILLFNISSIVCVSHHAFLQKKSTGIDIISLALGVICIILMLGVKIMADEIAREYRLGWETLGEWIILYAFLFVQLSYNILILFRLSHDYRVLYRNVGRSASRRI